MVAGIARFKGCAGILVSGVSWHGMLRVTFDAFRAIFLMRPGMRNPHVRIHRTLVRLRLNVLLIKSSKSIQGIPGTVLSSSALELAAKRRQQLQKNLRKVARVEKELFSLLFPWRSRRDIFISRLLVFYLK